MKFRNLFKYASLALLWGLWGIWTGTVMESIVTAYYMLDLKPIDWAVGMFVSGLIMSAGISLVFMYSFSKGENNAV